MNRFTSFFILFLIFALPVYSTGEGLSEKQQVETATEFPITGVTLFTAGLAQVVHETTVDGNEVIIFPVEPKDINDLLKSLNIEDLDGGIIDVVNFDSTDPLTVSLGGYRLNPSGAPSIRDFLMRSQGESVTVTAGEDSNSGRIFSVETTQKEEGVRIVLNLLNGGEITPVEITQYNTIKFDDLKIQTELEEALQLIAESRLKTVRILKISTKGSGTRRIRLSYIKAVPLWKTSYRIIVDQKGISRLEGWAIVQNTGGKAWNDINLAFAAGSPNAFTMDLSTPRYITRRRVDIAAETPRGPTSYNKAYAPPSAPSASRAYDEAPAMAMSEELYAYKDEETYTPAAVVSQASGVRNGNFYRYEVKHPVTVDARSSAMIPIISEKSAGTSLAVFDPSYNTVFKGVRLENNTDAHWAAGPVTVTEGRLYGGDALLPEMLPGSNRLITYAVHGTLEIEKSLTEQPQRITSLKISDGLLHRTDKITRETVYRIAGVENELLIIHPKQYGWKLTKSPEITEENSGEYRFSISDWKTPVIVGEEYIVSNQFSLINFRETDFAVYTSWNGISSEMKKAFERITELKKAVEELRTEISGLNGRLTRIERDQNRMRENMKVLDKESALFMQYAENFAEQEEEIAKLNTMITDNQNRMTIADRALRDYISSLNI